MAKHRTHHGIGRNLIKIWVAKFEAGGLDSDTAAADVLAEYEARIASPAAGTRSPWRCGRRHCLRLSASPDGCGR